MTKILVVGELNADLVVSGLSAFPALGQEVVSGELRTVLGSSSAICAAGLARLGAVVDLAGKLGDDHYGEFVAAELRRLGVGTDHLLRDPLLQTGLTIVLAYPHERALVTFPGSIAALRREEIPTSMLAAYCHLHVGSYFLQKGLQPGLIDLFDAAHGAGLSVSLDTGWDSEEKWGGPELSALLGHVDIFLPNERECCAIAGTEDVEDAARKLAGRARLVVVKRGPEGAMAMCQGHLIRSPGFRVAVVDTTGAGDSFDAGFLYAHVIKRQELGEALRFANACGAISTTGYGGTAAQPMLQQVLGMLDR